MGNGKAKHCVTSLHDRNPEMAINHPFKGNVPLERNSKMKRLRAKSSLLFGLLALASAVGLFTGQAFAQTQEKATLVVHQFSVASGVQWPYSIEQLQKATVAELMAKCGTRAEVLTETPENKTKVLILEGEILSWKAGNRATRLMIGLGAGRESAKIHYYLSDASGKKVFESTDTIRQSVWGGGYTPSVGELVQPFANKIANRISESMALGTIKP
jgi:hypothetical protein